MSLAARERLVRRARRGCRRSFDALWAAQAGALRRRVAAHVPAQFVDDVMQDVAVAALRGIARVRGADGFAAWLRAIAGRCAAEAWRRWLRERRHLAVDAPVESVAVAAPVPERVADLRTWLRLLPRRFRWPLWLRFVRGCSGGEIAQRLGTTPGTVRVTLCEAMHRLRARLPASWPA